MYHVMDAYYYYHHHHHQFLLIVTMSINFKDDKLSYPNLGLSLKCEESRQKAPTGTRRFWKLGLNLDLIISYHIR